MHANSASLATEVPAETRIDQLVASMPLAAEKDPNAPPQPGRSPKIRRFTNQEDKAMIWRGPIVTGLSHQFYEDVQWGELDVPLVDLPVGTSDAPLTVMHSLGVIENVAYFDARRGDREARASAGACALAAACVESAAFDAAALALLQRLSPVAV